MRATPALPFSGVETGRPSRPRRWARLRQVPAPRAERDGLAGLATKRQLRSVVFVALALLASCGLAESAAADGTPLRSIKTIVIDPGHGGGNEGAKGHSGASLEKDEVLKVALLAKQQLENDYPGIEVLLTRTLDVDVPLTERIHTANAIDADLFISIHMNSALNADATGLEVFYLRADKAMPLLTDGEGTWGQDFVRPEGDTPARFGPAGVELPIILDDLDRGRCHLDSAEFANLLLKELLRATGHDSRGVRQANFGVLRGARVPAVVVELGFLSNPSSERWLKRDRTQQQFALAISRAVARMDSVFYDRGDTSIAEPKSPDATATTSAPDDHDTSLSAFSP